MPFASWLYRIAKSELYQSFRDAKAKRTVNIDTVHLADMIDEMEEAGTDEDRKMLIHLIGELNDDEVQLIEMRYFEKNEKTI